MWRRLGSFPSTKEEAASVRIEAALEGIFGRNRIVAVSIETCGENKW